MAKQKPRKQPPAKRPKPPPQATTPSPPTASGKPPFPVVGIGASAGGVEAVKEFFTAMKPDSGLAFVVVPHLDPQHKSALPDILAKLTRMPVAEARHGVNVAPDHVYILPPNTEMAIVRGVLKLAPRSAAMPPMPIDTFLASLAEDRESQAVGIILSGSGSDGTRGLQAIKGAGGITFAQDDTAGYSSMPRSAVRAGCVDFVLPPSGIAAELVHLSLNGYLEPVPDEPPTPGQPDEYQAIIRALGQATGVDFNHYKISTLRRRIQRRMMARKTTTLQAYLECLRNDPHELRALYDESLIQVTSFFRDPEAHHALRTIIFPQIMEGRGNQTPLRLWVAGCSTGEEVYSMAISLLEFLGDRADQFPIKIFGTDISEKALSTAREGTYPENIAADISAERLRRFFNKTDSTYQINKRLRDLCVFARQDVAKDPPFSQLDLICCRNVLIYLDLVLQKRVLPIFHYALKPTGFLFLGTSETVGQHTDLFDLVDKKHKIYRRTSKPSRLDFAFASERHTRMDVVGVEPAKDHTGGAMEVQREADRIVLARYAPAGVVVDEDLRVIQFRGHTGTCLQPAPGPPSLDLLQMARQGLLAELRKTFEQARRKNLPARTEKVQVKTNNHFTEINLAVLPLTLPASGKRYFVILFEETETAPSRPAVTPQQPAAKPPSQGESEGELHLERLTHELAATRAYLQSVIEEKEAANEELRAANEEIVTNNEELQSTNEELETAKEELQATNEELTTVNDELQSRIAVASQLGDDLTNLIESVKIPTLVVDGDLRLRRLTPSAQRLLHLTAADVGRPIGDFKLKLSLPDLEAPLHEVLDTLMPRQIEVSDQQGVWYKMWIHPYKREGARIDGAIVTFLDIDALKRREWQIEQAYEYAAGIISTVREPLLILDARFEVRSANPAFYETFRTTAVETEKQPLYTLGNHQWDVPALRSLLDDVMLDNKPFTDFELTYHLPQMGRRILLLSARRIERYREAREPLTLLSIRDITERQRAEEALREGKARLQAIVEAAGDAIITINPNGRIESFNPAAERILGYPMKEVMGRDFAILLPPDSAGIKEQYLDCFWADSARSPAQRELKGQRKDGTIFPMELTLNTIDPPRVLVVILRDLSPRKELERQVLHVAEEEQRRIGQELHDNVGQEVTGLSMIADALAKRLKGPASQGLEGELADKVREGLERIHEQIRALSRGLIPVEVDGEGLRVALEDLAARTSEQGVACRFECDDGVTLDDPGKATHLFRIAQEAVSNALRHANPSDILIKLSQTDDTVTLRVQDDGVGISTAIKSGKDEGMGIRIMNYRAGLIGGTITIAAVKEGGSHVTCTVPREEDPS